MWDDLQQKCSRDKTCTERVLYVSDRIRVVSGKYDIHTLVDPFIMPLVLGAGTKKKKTTNGSARDNQNGTPVSRARKAFWGCYDSQRRDADRHARARGDCRSQE